MSKLENLLLFQIKAAAISIPEQEYRFAMHYVGPGPNIRARLLKSRLKDWRFDFCWPDRMLACEVEGGGWTGGRHTRGKGFEDDLIKYQAAMRMGYNVYRCSGAMIKSGAALKTIEILMEAE